MSEPTIVANLVAGERVTPSTDRWLDVSDPGSGSMIAQAAASGPEDADAAVAAAADAFPAWRDAGLNRRVDVLFAFRALLVEQLDELAATISQENGKTLADARGELRRGLQYVEHACSGAELGKGEHSANLAPGLDTWYTREPLGVFALVTPFNFPAMIPLYFGWAVVTGNAVVLKPSELCPLTPTRLVALAHQAGVPGGVLNVVHGGHDVVQRLVSHPDVAGVTFVGSSPAATTVYAAATGAGKRAQCQGGANNHLFVDAGADIDRRLPNLLSSCFAQAGQRCFAGSNLLVHEAVADEVIERFVAGAAALKIGYGADPATDVGPVITAAARAELEAAVAQAERSGAKTLLDGRGPDVAGYPQGHYLGPTILDSAPGSALFDEELFGPVRCVSPVPDVDAAVETINRSPFGHSAVIYTQDLTNARRFTDGANVGQVGINVGTPAPIAFYAVGGRKASFSGDLRGRARDAVDFYTDKKVVVQSF